MLSPLALLLFTCLSISHSQTQPLEDAITCEQGGRIFVDSITDGIDPYFFYGITICRSARYSANSAICIRQRGAENTAFNNTGAEIASAHNSSQSGDLCDGACTEADAEIPCQSVLMFTQCMTHDAVWRFRSYLTRAGYGGTGGITAAILEQFLSYHNSGSSNASCVLSDWAEGQMADDAELPWWCHLFPAMCGLNPDDPNLPPECQDITDPVALATCLELYGGQQGDGGGGGGGGGRDDPPPDDGTDPNYCQNYPEAPTCDGSSGGGGGGGGRDGEDPPPDTDPPCDPADPTCDPPPEEEECDPDAEPGTEGACDENDCDRICERVEEIVELSQSKFPFGMGSWLNFGIGGAPGVGCQDFNISLFGFTRAGGWCQVGVYNILRTLFRAGILGLMLFGFIFGLVKSVSQT